MSEDGTSLILPLLREIRAKLDDHDDRFGHVDEQFALLNKTFDDWQETTATGLDLASHANIRNTAIEAELEAFKRRGAALEGSFGPTGH